MSLRLVHDGGELERQMFGCTEEIVKEEINKLANLSLGNANIVLGFMLSDVQTMLTDPTPENLDKARQYLNRVKLALFLAGKIDLWARLK